MFVLILFSLFFAPLSSPQKLRLDVASAFDKSCPASLIEKNANTPLEASNANIPSKLKSIFFQNSIAICSTDPLKARSVEMRALNSWNCWKTCRHQILTNEDFENGQLGLGAAVTNDSKKYCFSSLSQMKRQISQKCCTLLTRPPDFVLS